MTSVEAALSQCLAEVWLDEADLFYQIFISLLVWCEISMWVLLQESFGVDMNVQAAAAAAQKGEAKS